MFNQNTMSFASLRSDKFNYESYINAWTGYYKRLMQGRGFECYVNERIMEGRNSKKEWVEAYQQTNNLTEDAIALDKLKEEWLALKNYQAQKKLEQRLEQQNRILEAKKDKCRDYGFKDDTDGMGLCLIELDKLAAIEQRQYSQQLAQNAAIAQQQADAKRQREAQALMNLGAIIGGAGTPRVISNPKPIIKTYPNSYSSTLTVPSNQNCPLTGSPITKQEVRGSNRICYYQ